MIDEKPLVSVCCATFNHVNYIRQCLDGFVMQQTSFPIEVIVNDDCSTDGTTEIVREYAEKYPDLILPIFHEENQYSKGVDILGQYIFPRCRGKYIALCEGDDYWVDPLKLQKQVDWLENHAGFSMCYSSFTTVGPNGDYIERPCYKAFIEESFSGNILPLLFNHNFILTPTVCIRRDTLKDYIESKTCIDYSLFFSAAFCGLAHYSEDSTACYRQHSQSATNRDLAGVNRVCEDAYLYWAKRLIIVYPKNISVHQWINCWKNIFFHYYSNGRFDLLSKDSLILRIIFYGFYCPQRRIKEFIHS